jgi:hypothetical protein
MRDAHYFRSQAERYFELARLMSLHVDSEYYSIQAEHCLARASELEARGAPPAPPADE